MANTPLAGVVGKTIYCRPDLIIQTPSFSVSTHLMKLQVAIDVNCQLPLIIIRKAFDWGILYLMMHIHHAFRAL